MESSRSLPWAAGVPAVIGQFFHNGPKRWVNEFAVIADRDAAILHSDRLYWKPSEYICKFADLPDSPIPASKPALRLTQMRKIAADFSVIDHFGWEESEITRQNLRLLTQPVYRYAEEGKILDGGLFVFAVGTDPECTLLLEAFQDDKGAALPLRAGPHVDLPVGGPLQRHPGLGDRTPDPLRRQLPQVLRLDVRRLPRRECPRLIPAWRPSPTRLSQPSPLQGRTIVGAFLVNVHVRTDDHEKLADGLRALPIGGCWVAPSANGWATVLEERASTQDDQWIRKLAAAASREAQAATIAFLVHDSDIFCYWLFDRGELLDEFNSCPEYFGETGGRRPITPPCRGGPMSCCGSVSLGQRYSISSASCSRSRRSPRTRWPGWRTCSGSPSNGR